MLSWLLAVFEAAGWASPTPNSPQIHRKPSLDPQPYINPKQPTPESHPVQSKLKVTRNLRHVVIGAGVPETTWCKLPVEVCIVQAEWLSGPAAFHCETKAAVLHEGSSFFWTL